MKQMTYEYIEVRSREPKISVESHIKRIQKFGILLVKCYSALKLQAQSIATENEKRFRLSFVHLRRHSPYITELAAAESKKVVTCVDYEQSPFFLGPSSKTPETRK